MGEKEEANLFLEGLESKLNAAIPTPSRMRASLDEIVAQARVDPAKKHLRNREHAFLNGIATPVIFEYLSSRPGMNRELAAASFLTESFRGLPKYSRASPARRLRHPFSKALGVDAAKIYQQWCGESERCSLTQSCPDFAFTRPYRIVFEAKYFQQGTGLTAKRELVKDAYQAFFYRGLPVDHDGPDRPNWDYPFSCLCAYDASPDGQLLAAWAAIDQSVRRGFWEGANVYIMILRGREI